MKTVPKNMLSRAGWPGAIVGLSLAALTLIVISCSNGDQAANSGGAAPTAPAEKSGAQLWADNCQRCHNTRSPSSYNDAQWEVAMMHMRVRANLTPEEHKKILAFLKQGK